MNHSTEQHHRQHVRLRDGSVRPLLPGEILPDGATLFTPLALRDAERQSLRDAAEEAYASYVAFLDWRTREDTKTMRPRAATAEQAYLEMCAELHTAWPRR